jgi:prepilin-type processing-associated H-X9-DG protein
MNTNHPSTVKSLSARRRDHDRAYGAFTLAELLVLLATAGVLAVLMLPALANTQPANTKAFQCLNNLRQMAVAWTLYSEDNHDLLANNFGSASVQSDLAASPPIYRNWVCDTMAWTLNSYVTNLDDIRKVPFNNYVGDSVAIYKCPADNYLSGLQQASGWTGRPRSYSMNAYFGPYNPTWTSTANIFDPAYKQFLKGGAVPNPANLYVFLDEHADSINDGYMRPFQPGLGNYTGFNDLVASYHAGACDFAFADGHSQIHKWKSTACTILPVKMQPLTMVPFGADPVNAAIDAQWIASHASVLQ